MLLGDIDRAMRVARNSETDGGLFEIELIYVDEFRDFRIHPGFQDFVNRIGLAGYWDSVGCDWVADRLDCR